MLREVKKKRETISFFFPLAIDNKETKTSNPKSILVSCVSPWRPKDERERVLPRDFEERERMAAREKEETEGETSGKWK